MILIFKQIGICYNDEKRIGKVIMNLLSNAIKFTKYGGKVKLEVKAL